MIHEWQDPDAPWLPRQAIWILSEWLKPTDHGLEWGSGRSTAWFAGRVEKLTSIEHDPGWHRRVQSMLLRKNAKNVELLLFEVHGPDVRSADESEYVSIGGRIPPSSLDFVLVDGLYRDNCAKLAMELIKPGGLLIIDNANWYLPHGSHSPGSIGESGEPTTNLWKEMVPILKGWRCIWTSNGVTDTAIFAKYNSGSGISGSLGKKTAD